MFPKPFYVICVGVLSLQGFLRAFNLRPLLVLSVDWELGGGLAPACG